LVLEDRIKRLDKSDMLGTVASLPGQLREGLEIGAQAWKGLLNSGPEEIVVAGMGGSAIGGDIVRAYLTDGGSRPVFVSRDYTLPGFVGRDSLVVVSSYSGNTEEALSSFEDAARRGARIACITAGGRLLERSRELGAPVAVIPPGLPPRGALGYSVAPLLALVWAVGFDERDRGGFEECLDVLNSLIRRYSDLGEGNEAIVLARKLSGRVPLVYCSNRIDAVGVRWKGQLSENSKKLAYTSVLSEMNHNEIMGWENEDDSMKPGVIFIRWEGDNRQMVKRFDFMRGLIDAKGALLGEYVGEGKGILAQMFSLIVLGDYVSVYLALLRGLDPTPVGTIEQLKVRLKEN
jgi:glucose/mannose-6-phosphate isomerase